jgi:hypothetical protein
VRERDCCQKKRISQKRLLRGDGDRLTPDLLAFEKQWSFVEIGKEEDGKEEEILMLRRNLNLCVCVFHQRERLMTTTSQQESRVMQSGICDDVFFLFSLENPPLFCSELQQGFDLKAGSKSPASPLTHGVPVHASLFPAAEIVHGYYCKVWRILLWMSPMFFVAESEEKKIMFAKFDNIVVVLAGFHS